MAIDRRSIRSIARTAVGVYPRREPVGTNPDLRRHKVGIVIYDKSMSLDGFIAGANMRVEAGLGDDGERLHDWAFKDPAGMS
jgi:hypothetical protein